ncbi:unnamed protein product [Urochloa decumbens]|uniref:Uncharacterized protein n=1 Tax=Urochloa decumbens TaxID=240449 RepID=A0ABC8VLI5_9POAL
MPSKARVLTKSRVRREEAHTIPVTGQTAPARSLLPSSSPNPNHHLPHRPRRQRRSPPCSIPLSSSSHGQGVLQQRVRGGGRVQPAGAAGRRHHRAGIHAPLHAAQEALRRCLPLLLKTEEGKAQPLPRRKTFMGRTEQARRRPIPDFPFFLDPIISST